MEEDVKRFGTYFLSDKRSERSSHKAYYTVVLSSIEFGPDWAWLN